VPNDVAKAVAVRAHWLLIMTPRPAVAEACARKLAREHLAANLMIKFLTIGTLGEWFANSLPLFSGSIDPGKSIHSSVASKLLIGQHQPK
jgi:hypothetical protein